MPTCIHINTAAPKHYFCWNISQIECVPMHDCFKQKDCHQEELIHKMMLYCCVDLYMNSKLGKLVYHPVMNDCIENGANC